MAGHDDGASRLRDIVESVLRIVSTITPSSIVLGGGMTKAWPLPGVTVRQGLERALVLQRTLTLTGRVEICPVSLQAAMRGAAPAFAARVLP
jgi:hypothetical protein